MRAVVNSQMLAPGTSGFGRKVVAKGERVMACTGEGRVERLSRPIETIRNEHCTNYSTFTEQMLMQTVQFLNIYW